MNYHSVKESTRKSGAFQVNINKPFPILKRISNYEYNEADYLGKGSFAKVYKGINKLTNEVVAIKVIELKKLREERLTQLLVEEVKIIKSVDHPSIVKCHEVLTSQNNCYIITELCDGGDLLELIKKQKSLPFTKPTWRIIYEIYQALKYLNERQIVHRDIKTANILFHNDGAKLADFGFAKQIYSTLFKDIFVGSPYYMSPEGHLKQVYGPKTDVWSFGIVLYQLLHGHTPFHKCHHKKQLLQEVVRPISLDKINKNIPHDLRDLIVSCLIVEEQKRITIGEIQNTPFFKRILSELRGDDITKTPSSKIFSTSYLSTQTDLSSPYLNFGSSNKNKSIRIDRKHENANRLNVLMNHRQNSQTRQTPENKPHIISSSNQKEGKIQNMIPHHTPTTHSLTPPPIGYKQMKQQSKQKQKYIFKATNQILGYSVKTFKECLNLLHYCRLCFKTFSLLPDKSQQNSILLSSWTVKLLDQIKSLTERNQIDFSSSSSPQERENKLKEVVAQYIFKYSKELLFKNEPMNMNIIVEGTFNIWKQIDSTSNDLVVKHYTLYLAETTWLLREALEKKDMGYFVKSTNLQGFLGHKTASLNDSTYESLRKNLSH